MAFLSRLGLLIRVSRPMFWMGPPVLYLLGILHSDVSPETIPATILGIALSFPLSLCKTIILSYFPKDIFYFFFILLLRDEGIFAVNDAYDYESDIQNPRKTRPWADGTSLDRADCQYALSAAKVSTALVLSAALPISLQSPQILGYIILGLIISWTYSSPPIRFKERPIADSLSTGLLCWLAWACGFSTSDQATWASNYGWYVFFIGTGVHSLGAMVDAKPDAAAKHRTIATVYGERFAAFFGLIFW